MISPQAVRGIMSVEPKIPYVKVTRPDSHGEKYGCWCALSGFSAAETTTLVSRTRRSGIIGASDSVHARP